MYRDISTAVAELVHGSSSNGESLVKKISREAEVSIRDARKLLREYRASQNGVHATRVVAVSTATESKREVARAMAQKERSRRRVPRLRPPHLAVAR